jgi:hypothetical protein
MRVGITVRLDLENDEWVEITVAPALDPSATEASVAVVSNLGAGRDEEYMQEYNAAVDGLESMLLGLAGLGLLDRFSKEELTSAVTTALAGISNHLT